MRYTNPGAVGEVRKMNKAERKNKESFGTKSKSVDIAVTGILAGVYAIATILDHTLHLGL
ncbi:MAG: hypothetical protein ACYC9U_13220 [Nitrososphaerales archaeon]